MLLSPTLITQLKRTLALTAKPRHRRPYVSRTEQLECRELLTAIAPLGGETLVNTTTNASQSLPAVAMDADGDYVVTWRSNGQDGSGYGVYAQRYNAAGNRQGSEFRVNSTITGNQLNPALAMDSSGDFVIVWMSHAQDGSSYGIYARQYNSGGVAQGSEFRVNTTVANSQRNPAVAMDADGDFVVTWMSNGQDGSGYGIYARRYNPAGAAQGSEFKVNTTVSNSQRNPAVAMDADGDFVVTWMSSAQDGSGYGIYAQRYSSAGAPRGTEFKVNTYTANNQRDAKVAMDADGDFVVTWTSPGQEQHYGVYAQRYNSAGVAQGGEFRVNTYTNSIQRYSTVTMDPDGDFVVTWSSYGQDGSGYGIYAQRYNAGSAVQGPEFRVNTFRTSHQQLSAVAMEPGGGFLVAWMSESQDGSGTGIYAQLYQAESSIRLNGVTMQILGTDLADTITVYRTGPDLLVRLNGAVSNLGDALVTDIILLGADGSDVLTLAGDISQSAVLDGGNGNDTLTGGGGHDYLQGGAGNDIYGFNTNWALGMDSVTDNSGVDRLSFTGSSGSVIVDLSSTAPQLVNANLMLTLNSSASIENIYGGSGDDTLIGNTAANELWGGPGNDNLAGGDGIDWLHGQAGDDNIDGGAGNDTYGFNTNTNLGADRVTDSGGIDRLYFVGSTDAITVNLTSTAVQTVNTQLMLLLAIGTSLENVEGGSGDDTLIGNSLDNTLVGGGGHDNLSGGDGADWLEGQAGNDVLDGGDGNDTYTFVTNTPLGSDSLIDSSGVDRLTFYRSTANVIVSLASTAPQVVNANLNLVLRSSISVENITGGSGNDTLTGNTLNNTLTGGAGDDSLEGGDGRDLLSGEAGNDSLSGGPGNDTYTFNTNAALGTDSLTDSSGIDQLDFAGSVNNLAVHLGSTAVQTINANLTLTLDSATSIENVYGGSGNDTLAGNSLNNLLVGGPGNDVLTGGSGNDGYGFDLDSILGSDTIDESAGGIDTLDFRGTSLRGIAIDLSNAAPQVVSTGYLTLTLLADNSLENVFGGEQGDRLIGNSLANTLTGGGGIDLLRGAAGNDTYVFDTDQALGSDLVDEEAGGGLDTLDFFETTTMSVMVSLMQSSPQSVNSHLTLTLSAIDAIEKVAGGALNDILIGNSLANILIGNDGNDILSGRAGNDTLAGGAGKNILIGGFGSDQLSGGASEDLLLGARYLLEDDTVALDSLRREWTSAGSFDDRVRHLLGTLNGGANDGFTLTPSTVREDSSRDTLNGAGSQDWYLGNRLGFPTLWRDIINEPDLDSLFTEIGSWL